VHYSLSGAWYVQPALRVRSFADALRPLLLLHCFRYVGLMFLIPGVTAEPLDARFAVPAAYGDLPASGLAFAALGALHLSRPVALTVVWIFNIWGLADLFNAVARGVAYTPDEQVVYAAYAPKRLVRWPRRALGVLRGETDHEPQQGLQWGKRLALDSAKYRGPTSPASVSTCGPGGGGIS
jgi:hypothetical protein